MHILCSSSVHYVYVHIEVRKRKGARQPTGCDETVYICHVIVCSVRSCFRQMTYSGPQGLPVILHPLSPTAPADRPPVYFPSLCIFHLSACSNDCILIWKLHVRIFLLMYLLELLHKLGTSVTSVFVCACMWIMGSCEHEQHSQCAEMGARKCSFVKAPPCWIHWGGGTQEPAAKWCRSFLYLQDAGPWIRMLTHKYSHLGSRWQVLCGG